MPEDVVDFAVADYCVNDDKSFEYDRGVRFAQTVTECSADILKRSIRCECGCDDGVDVLWLYAT